jgi:hypothetical protein
MTAAQGAQKVYRLMLASCRNGRTAEDWARSIRAQVENGQTTWKELGFTSADLNERVLQVKRREASYKA